MPSLAFLSLFYFVALGALAGVVPFLGARLDAAGLSGRELGLLLAMLPVARLVTGPLWGWLADRFQVAGTLLRVGCAMSLAGGVALLWADDPLLAGIGLFLFSAGRAPLGPLVDTITLRALSVPGRDRREYGKIRLWGSVGFLALALVAGRMAEVGLDPMQLGVGLLALHFLLSFRFSRHGSGGPAPVGPALRALARQPFLVPLLGMATLQALTLSVYDTFFSAHVQALGLPATVTAAAVALGVAVEVAVMRVGHPLLARFGAAPALLVAALTAVPRWWLTSWVTAPVPLVGVQVLHGVCFGVFWIAGVQMMAEKAPVEVSASAQSLFLSAGYGVGALIGSLVAGEVRAIAGTGAIFEASTLISLGASAFAAWLVWVERRPTAVEARGTA